MDYHESIRRELSSCLTKTNLGIGQKRSGKVRDTYELDDVLILITTDRQSAFDRILAAVPFKGQVLNQISAWWFEKTAHIIPNHVLSMPDPNVTVAKKCTVFPVEVVVRGYITGTTDTSAWVNYDKGVRNFCGHILPEGLRKNQKFEQPIVTPTTKDVKHDRLISPPEIISEGLMTATDWEYIHQKALEVFRYGQSIAQEHGLILVDTKYEFGRDTTGEIVLVDEIHTPDSSRYWIAETYEERFGRGEEPEYIDKEFLRLWFKEHCDPYNDPELPAAPEELVVELSRRYIQLYEIITGRPFQFPHTTTPIEQRIRENLGRYVGTAAYIQKMNTLMIPPGGVQINPKDTPSDESAIINSTDSTTLPDHHIYVVLILGSEKDSGHAKKITDALDVFAIPWAQYIASAHKQARAALQILDEYKDKKIIYVTIAGRSNALSGFVAGNTDNVTIACPPFSDKMDMLVNIHSTIQMPSHVPVMTILEPKNVALAIKRIIDLSH